MDFCQTRPPAGLGVTPDALAATITRREAVQAAAHNTTGEVLPHGGDRKSEDAKSRDNSSLDSRTERAKANNVGLTTQKKLDYLATERPDLRAEVAAGRLTAHRAYVVAGRDLERWSAPADVSLLAGALARRYDTHQIAELVAALLKHLTGAELDNAAAP